MFTFSVKKLLLVVVLAVFGVLTHWEVWNHFIYAFGWNTLLFWLGIWCLLLHDNDRVSIRKDWRWLVPLWMIVLSFALYENPWLKCISVMVLPVVTGIFYSLGQLKNKYSIYWNLSFFIFLLARALSPITCVSVVCGYCKRVTLSLLNQKHKAMGKRILLGMILLYPLAIVVTILLASADKNFGNAVNVMLTTIFESFSIVLITKFIIIIFTIIALLAVSYGWRLSVDYKNKQREWSLDGVVVGIILTGLLSIYILFLYLQLEYLLIESLPIHFSQAEAMVKSGFWQLFFLSILNATLFFVIYKNTTMVAQIVLRIFIAASGLLLLSACWRLGLYVYWYGLSYEKFFASYTCLYALFIFMFLLTATFSKTRKNIFSLIAFSSLWFYAFAAVIPVERIIVSTNHYLAEAGGTKIYLYDLTSLSIDVAAQINDRYSYLRKDEKLWDYWLHGVENECARRPLYAQNISFYINCKSLLK